jgi:hypothetical protein
MPGTNHSLEDCCVALKARGLNLVVPDMLYNSYVSNVAAEFMPGLEPTVRHKYGDGVGLASSSAALRNNSFRLCNMPSRACSGCCYVLLPLRLDIGPKH